MDGSERPTRLKWKFSPLEDMRLSKVVSWLGAESWTVVAAHMPGRNARQCRERWMNYIDPNLSDSPMSLAEEGLLDAKYAELGPKWQQIAVFLPGRGKNFLKNHWLSKQKRIMADTEHHTQRQKEDQAGCFNIFDLAFCEEEKQETFWQLVADGIF